MASVEVATNARVMLEGKDIFQDCCTLKIIYSNLPDVNIKSNGPRSRDFTAPDPSLITSTMFSNIPGFPLPGLLPIPAPALLAMPSLALPLLQEKQPTQITVVLVNNLPVEGFTPDQVIIIILLLLLLL
jgi:hypothetical protein